MSKDMNDQQLEGLAVDVEDMLRVVYIATPDPGIGSGKKT